MSLPPLRLSPHAMRITFFGSDQGAKKNSTSIIMCVMQWACHLLARARSVPTKFVTNCGWALSMGEITGF